VMVSGGSYYDDAYLYLTGVEIYDPQEGSWTQTAGLSIARDNHSATLLAGGKVLVAGGWGGEELLASTEIFDPDAGEWSPAGLLENARSSHTATLLNDGRVLVAGGSGINETLNTVEIFTPAQESIPPTAGFTFSPQVIYVGNKVTFTNTTAGTEPVDYLWDFGDGSTSNAKHPEYIYNTAGLFPVKMIATNQAGSGEFELNVQVGQKVFLPLVGRE
jgi:PKD repeat protein